MHAEEHVSQKIFCSILLSDNHAAEGSELFRAMHLEYLVMGPCFTCVLPWSGSVVLEHLAGMWEVGCLVLGCVKKRH